MGARGKGADGDEVPEGQEVVEVGHTAAGLGPFAPTHVSHKAVEAHPIAAAEFHEDGSGKVALKGGRIVEVPAGFVRAGRVPSEGDMLVRYEPTDAEPDGYLSHSPLAVFNAGYSSLAARRSSLSFGAAIEALKRGERVCRAGWNGKGMWLGLTPGSTVPATAATRSGALLAYVEAEGVDGVRILSHIDMRAADGSLVIGWLASQTDMLADDWMVLPAEAA